MGAIAGLDNEEPTTPIRLADTYRDTITGYVGVAVSYSRWLYGGDRVGLERAGRNGSPQIEWFDVQRLRRDTRSDPVRT